MLSPDQSRMEARRASSRVMAHSAAARAPRSRPSHFGQTNPMAEGLQFIIHLSNSHPSSPFGLRRIDRLARRSFSEGGQPTLRRPAEHPRAGGAVSTPAFRGGKLISCSPKGAERRDGAGCVRDTPGRAHDAARQALARRLASPCDRGRCASRRSTVAIFGSGSALPAPALSTGATCSDAPRGRVVVPGGRFPCRPRLR